MHMDTLSVTARARRIMQEFAVGTGLSPPASRPRRYLWTDAFAVCNYLSLFSRTKDPAFLHLAEDLVGQVHDTLGRYREDDSRTGWISGFSDQEGMLHPTTGGFRIGKTLPERKPGEPFDERLEWDRDGQYFHYLTKWAHALVCMSRAAGDPKYAGWARELVRGVHPHFFSRSPGGTGRMYWKMSTDLSRPLVPTMGQHDPLDGYVTYREICSVETNVREDRCLPEETGEMRSLCRGVTLATEDPLGLGGLLTDALRVSRLMAAGRPGFGNLPESILSSALPGIGPAANGFLSLPARYRLPFRELGLAIGLKALIPLKETVGKNPGIFGRIRNLGNRIDAGLRYLPLAGTIEEFWLAPVNQSSEMWTEHRDINSVMLATSLVPEGFLTL
jgi:hypothetical protein